MQLKLCHSVNITFCYLLDMFSDFVSSKKSAKLKTHPSVSLNKVIRIFVSTQNGKVFSKNIFSQHIVFDDHPVVHSLEISHQK
jgi:hypothetical protein